ncbi:hypothetical protein Pelo_8989 [Pelomyxa schiedti]|nr:hypothetical protein Pelo_8989 [Pelomyxa schiedti]
MFEVVSTHIAKHGFDRAQDPETSISDAAASHDQALFRAILNLLTVDERSEIDWEDMFFETKDLEGANIILSESGILPTDKAKVRKFIKKCVESVDGKDTPAGRKCVSFRKWFVSAVTSGTGTIGGFLYGHQNHLPPLDFALAVEDLELTDVTCCWGKPKYPPKKIPKVVDFCKILVDAGYQPLASDLNYAIKHHNLELVKILAHHCFDAKLALFCSKLPERIWYEMAEKRRPNCPGLSNKERYQEETGNSRSFSLKFPILTRSTAVGTFVE